MAEIVKGASATISTTLPGGGDRVGSFICADAVIAGDACYLNSSGQIKQSSGAAATAAAQVHGWAAEDHSIGETCALWGQINLGYGVPSGTTPGTQLYLSSTVAGGLADAATTGGVTACALVLTGGRIRTKLVF